MKKELIISGVLCIKITRAVTLLYFGQEIQKKTKILTLPEQQEEVRTTQAEAIKRPLIRFWDYTSYALLLRVDFAMQTTTAEGGVLICGVIPKDK